MPYPLTNILLDALPESDRKELLPMLTRVSIPVRTSMYEQNESPRYVHFLTSGIASVVTTMKDGSTTEVGTLGREGVPQGLHALGSVSVPTRCFMQISGTALRMDFRTFRRVFDARESLRRLVLAYAQYQAVLSSQVAGCNRLHEAEPRLARWLLMIRDRTGNSVLKLTQEFLAEMIGSQRTTVSSVAGSLQERGSIEYSRGIVRVLDPVDLENISCECYQTTRQILIDLYKLAGQMLEE